MTKNFSHFLLCFFSAFAALAATASESHRRHHKVDKDLKEEKNKEFNDDPSENPEFIMFSEESVVELLPRDGNVPLIKRRLP